MTIAWHSSRIASWQIFAVTLRVASTWPSASSPLRRWRLIALSTSLRCAAHSGFVAASPGWESERDAVHACDREDVHGGAFVAGYVRELRHASDRRVRDLAPFGGKHDARVAGLGPRARIGARARVGARLRGGAHGLAPSAGAAAAVAIGVPAAAAFLRSLALRHRYRG
jgi:hypothetical protein